MFVLIPLILTQQLKVHSILPSFYMITSFSSSEKSRSHSSQRINSSFKCYSTQKAISELLDPTIVNTNLLTRVQYIFQVFLSLEGEKNSSVFEVTGASSLLHPPLLWLCYSFEIDQDLFISVCIPFLVLFFLSLVV